MNESSRQDAGTGGDIINGSTMVYARINAMVLSGAGVCVNVFSTSLKQPARNC